MKYIISLLIFLLWAFLGMWWYYSCPMCSTEKTSTTEQHFPENNTTPMINSATENSIPNGFHISNSIGADVFNFSDKMNLFNHKDSLGIVHVPTTSLHFRDSIFNYLNRYQDKELNITGWYTNDEWHNNDETKNFGLERAGYIKSMLMQFGVNPDRISLSATKEAFHYTNGHYKGGIQMAFKDLDIKKAAVINQGITNKTLYTHFNARNFKPDNTLKAYTAELKNYVIKHPNKSILITGHTDSVGDASVNEIVGRDRATNVLNYFIQSGIAKNKLKSDSKGETEPVATNNTDEGRALNRRIEIKVN